MKNVECLLSISLNPNTYFKAIKCDIFEKYSYKNFSILVYPTVINNVSLVCIEYDNEFGEEKKTIVIPVFYKNITIDEILNISRSWGAKDDNENT